jgi:Domain of unknown function (DUF4383)
MDGMASHIPVNHQLRSFWRTVAAACGLYVLIFGIVALTRTGGLGFFAQDGLPHVLGLRSNRAFAILSVVVGALFVFGAVVGRNIGRWINLVGGMVFMLAGFVMICLLQTRLNFLGFEMSTVVVSFLFGLLMFTAGLYGRVGPPNQRHREEQFRHGGPDPEKHPWQFKGGPKPSHQTEDHRFA